MAEPLIELDGVGHAYGGRRLFAGASLGLAPGSFHFLTGPSGAGKTTLLRLLTGDLLPTEGRVAIFGQDPRAMTRDAHARARGRIGVVHQDCQFLDHLPVAENVLLPLAVAGRRAEGLPHLAALLAWVGLGRAADRLPPELSGGERQRAELARAVIASPQVLLADGPAGNLDRDTSQRLLALPVELNRMGTAVLVATHDLTLVRAAKAQVAARVLRLKGGTLQAAGADL